MSESASPQNAGITIPMDTIDAPATNPGQVDLKDAVQEAKEAGATPAEIKEMIKEFDLKVNGKSKKVKIDLNNEKDMVRRLQLAEAGQSAMQEKALAIKEKQELEALVTKELQRLKTDPWEFLKELGLNPDDLAEKRIQSKIEELSKSPEQIERETMQKELEFARKQLLKIEEEKRTSHMQQLEERITNDIDKQITDVLSEDKELPKTRKTVVRIADALYWALANGFPDASVRDVLPMVKKDIEREYNEFFTNAPEDLMERYIGHKNLERMRNTRIAKAKQVPNANVTPVARPVESKDTKRDKQKMKDFFRNMK